MKLAIYSRGIWKINGLAALLPEYELVYKQKADVYAGWGNKRTGRRAQNISGKRNANSLSLEDGFIRSYGLGVHKASPMGMVLDDIGIYYDALNPSRLEKLISEGCPGLLERANAAMDFIKKHRISKYNDSLDIWPYPKGKYVLVVDQCAGDYSITCGMANADSFRLMLEKARTENPQAKIIIKIHPDVIAGKRKGYLKQLARADDILLSQNINPHIIFENVEKVYVVTSLLGMEALLHNKPVRCFGMPFYAGWGATQDEIKIERRNVKRNIAEIFAAAYIKYSRYIDPYTLTSSNLEDALGTLAFIKSYYAKHRHNYYCLGFSKWKHGFVTPYIKSPYNKVVFYKSEDNALEAARNDANAAILVWAAREKPELVNKAGNLPVFRMEDGFIRGAGLGSDLVAANSLILDRTGIHFDHSHESDLENILNNKEFSKEELQRAQILKDTVLHNSISKYNLKTEAAVLNVPAGKKKLLVIGQVESDASIRLGATDIKTNAALIKKVRGQNPDAFIIYKPHPDVLSGNRKGDWEEDGADIIVKDAPLTELFKIVDEVHVITSLAGFEAMMHGKKIFCHGLPFYSGWGATIDANPHERRTRRRNSLEIFASAIIDYPLYYDFSANLPCTPEVLVAKIAGKKLTPLKKRSYTRVLNWICLILKK